MIIMNIGFYFRCRTAVVKSTNIQCTLRVAILVEIFCDRPILFPRRAELCGGVGRGGVSHRYLCQRLICML